MASAKTTLKSESLIIHSPLMCENIRTVAGQGAPLEALQSSTIAARFWAKVNRTSPSECWPWTAAKQGGRYGYIRIAKRPYGAHRIAWQLANGREIPAGLQVRHDCDNPICCNPAHLQLGSNQDNVNDRRQRGHTRNRFTGKLDRKAA